MEVLPTRPTINCEVPSPNTTTLKTKVLLIKILYALHVTQRQGVQKYSKLDTSIIVETPQFFGLNVFATI
jgi:hypothetical protein